MRPVHLGLNLLYLTPGEVGGTEVYATELLRALTQLLPADRLTLFLRPSARDWGPPEAIDCSRVVIPGTDVHTAARIGIEALLLPALAQRHGIHVLHSLGYHGPWRGGVPSVVSVHDTNFADFLHGTIRGRALGVAVPRAMAHARAVITASAHFQAVLAQRYPWVLPRLATIPYGPGSVSPGGQWAPDDAAPYLLAFGAVSPNKNLPRLAEAWRLVAPSLPGWMLRVVGTVPAEVADLLRATASVRLEGFVSESRKGALLRGAQAVVFPSRYEGFGFPAVEAMATGVPLAASRTTALGEVVGDGGLLFDPDDVSAIADAMRLLAGAPAVRQALARRAIARARAFSWEVSARAHLALYEAVLSGAAVPRTG
jgi:glycosyltransferase involved in cell wall biosynthesis